MKTLKKIVILFVGILLLTACSSEVKEDQGLLVVTSFTIIEDMVKEIGGDLVKTHNLVPIGTDPHEYDPLPEDVKAATDADLIIYNGFNLEGNEEFGWIVQLANTIDKDISEFYQLMEGVEPLYLEGSDGKEAEINPHTFLDPVLGMHMAEKVYEALLEHLPEHEEELQERADKYLGELEEIHHLYEEKINDIPKEDRILITSERAYQYLAKRYGLEEGYLFQIDTEETGTPEQITSLIKFIQEKQPPVLFVETNVDQRGMEAVSKETGVEIYAEIFSDEIGKPGDEGDTYLKFLRYNIEKIHEGLTSKQR